MPVQDRRRFILLAITFPPGWRYHLASVTRTVSKRQPNSQSPAVCSHEDERAFWGGARTRSYFPATRSVKVKVSRRIRGRVRERKQGFAPRMEPSRLREIAAVSEGARLAVPDASANADLRGTSLGKSRGVQDATGGAGGPEIPLVPPNVWRIESGHQYSIALGSRQERDNRGLRELPS